MRNYSVCAVIPAAGKGTRLGLGPKIFAPIDDTTTVFDVIYKKLAPHVDDICLVLSPEGKQQYETVYKKTGHVTVRLQKEPLGMGHAVFEACYIWQHYDVVLVLWGDCPNVSTNSIRTALPEHYEIKSCHVPVKYQEDPYVSIEVQYNWKVAQKREGDPMPAGGWSDIGLFSFSAQHLAEAARTMESKHIGKITQEENFLPVLHQLYKSNWHMYAHEVYSQKEALGINTPQDLALTRSYLKSSF